MCINDSVHKKKAKIPHSLKHIKNTANTNTWTCFTYEYFNFPPDDRTNIQINTTRLNIITQTLIERRHFLSPRKNARNLDHGYYLIRLEHREVGSGVIYVYRYKALG